MLLLVVNTDLKFHCPNQFKYSEASQCSMRESQSLLHQSSRVRVSYHFTCLKSKATILLVVSSLVVSLGPYAIHTLLEMMALKNFGSNFPVLKYKGQSQVGINNLLGLGAAYIFVYLLFPLVGFLGDVCFGRYRTLIVSLLVMSLGSLVFAAAVFSWEKQLSVLDIKSNDSLLLGILLVGVAISSTGLAGFQANVLQFGVDQLRDASSGEVSAMIRWYLWVSITVEKVTEILVIWYFFCNTSNFYLAGYVAGLCFCFIVIALLISVLKCKRQLVIEPRSQNPYKMVCAVLSFARKHSHPLRRSSLLYWSDKSASRIDFAKEKYGGPFSSEEVEDVKTFFRMLLIILAMGVYFFLQVPGNFSLLLFAQHLNQDSIANCTSHVCSIHNHFIVALFVVNGLTILFACVYEFLINPLFGMHFPNLLKSFGIGLLLMIASVLYTLVVDTVGHTMHKTDNITCMFTLRDDCGTTPVGMDVAILVVPMFFNVLSFMLVFNSGLQFIVAQAPHAMKGMLIGLFYFTNGPYTFLGTLLVLPFSYPFKAHRSTYPSCGFGYYLTNSVLAILGLAVYSLVSRCYKYRTRQQYTSTEQGSL